MTKCTQRTLILTMLSLISPLALAEASNWEIIPAESTLSFTAKQNGAPVTGTFKTFTGDIKCDLAQPEGCNIKIIVDINSVSDAYNELSDTLKTKQWFDAKSYPQAVFQSNQVSKASDKGYEAKGNLTIRDKTVPVILSFQQTEDANGKGQFKGTTTIKRTDFGVGSGEWSDTKAIKDEVQIDFVLSAMKK